MNYWLLDSYSISSVCLLPLWFTNLKANNILWHLISFCIASFVPCSFSWRRSMEERSGTVRHASHHQKSVSEVGTFDCGTLLNLSSIFMPLLRINIAILPVRRDWIFTHYWTHHTFIFYETKMFWWERVQLFYFVKRLTVSMLFSADRFDVKNTSSRPLNVSVFSLFRQD